MADMTKRLLTMMVKGTTYRRAIKTAGWDRAGGRLTRIAKANGFKLVKARLDDGDYSITAKAVKARKAA